jgi:hypothetical protein
MLARNARAKSGQTGSFRVDELLEGALDIAGGKAPLKVFVIPHLFCNDLVSLYGYQMGRYAVWP